MTRSFLLSLLITFSLWGVYHLQDNPGVESPRAGEALQGVVQIHASTDLNDFQSAELTFAYDEERPDTWFWIETDQDAPGSALASWDTTVLADGNYRLRLRLTRADSSTVETDVRGLRVRNYTPVETNTPQPVLEAPAASLEPSRTPLRAGSLDAQEVTAQPDNERGSGVFGLVQWLGYIVLGFVAVGLIALVRSLFQRT